LRPAFKSSFLGAIADLDAAQALKSTCAGGKKQQAAARRAAHEPAAHPGRARPYHTRQEFTGYMGWPFLQLKALPNSSKFCTEPFTRYWPGECGSTSESWRATCSVWFWHQT
jgi:hypothetical protein